MKIKRHLLMLALMTLGTTACDSPDTPVGQPSVPTIPSEAPDTGDPPCLQTLQCIIDNTNNNGLRKQTQEAINQLFVASEPEYTRICLAQADELSDRVPECQNN